MDHAALLNALTNYYKIMFNLEYTMSDADVNMPMETYDAFVDLKEELDDRWNSVRRNPKFIDLIDDVISNMDEQEDEAFPEDEYPNANFTKQNYLDLLRFGDKLNEYFDQLQRFIPHFDSFDVDEFDVLRNRSETEYANLLSAYNAKYWNPNAYNARREPARAA